MAHPLDGVYAAVVTPFDGEGKVLDEPLQAHLRHLERKGCDGALVCGTTGEAASLSVEERVAVFEAARRAGVKLKLLAGTGAASLEDAVRLTRSAFDSGADAAVVIPPFFHRELSDDGLFLFYSRLVERSFPADGRLLLYHNPVTTSTSISFELIRRLIDRFPDQVVGIKDSGSDLDHSRRLNQEFPHLRVFVGDDRHLSANLAASGAGAITGLANLFADLLRDILRHHRAGSPTADAQQRLDHAHGLLKGVPRVAGTKALLAAGHVIPSDTVRPPLRPLTAVERALLAERFHLDERLPDKVDLAELARLTAE